MLNFIGNGSAFSTRVNNSAYYKDGDTMLLVDCGETVFQEILKRNLLDGVKNLLVLITHSHSDHCGSLSGLVWYCEYITKAKVVIVAPLSVFHILDFMGNHRESYFRVIAKSHELAGVGPFRYIPVGTTHQRGMDCFGYSISIDLEMEVYNCYYTGDTKNFDIELINSLKLNKLNDIYCDVTVYDGDDNVHMNLDKLATLVPKKYRSSIHLMHLADNFPDQKAIELGFKITEVS